MLCFKSSCIVPCLYLVHDLVKLVLVYHVHLLYFRKHFFWYQSIDSNVVITLLISMCALKVCIRGMGLIKATKNRIATKGWRKVVGLWIIMHTPLFLIFWTQCKFLIPVFINFWMPFHHIDPTVLHAKTLLLASFGWKVFNTVTKWSVGEKLQCWLFCSGLEIADVLLCFALHSYCEEYCSHRPPKWQRSSIV